jgi:hypothetical protein
VPNGSLRKDVQAVLEIGSQQWAAVQAVSAEKTEAVTPDELHKQLVDCGLSESAAAALTRVLLVIAGNARRLDRSAASVLEEIAQALPPDLRSELGSRSTDMCRLAAAASSAAKALDLALDHRRIFRDLLVYIDLRPIFKDAEGSSARPERISGFVNGFNLRLTYYQDGDTRTVEMFADVEDLRAIQRQIDRAMAKLEVMREYLRKPHSTALMLMGQDDHVTR